jgi:hypothetical protein
MNGRRSINIIVTVKKGVLAWHTVNVGLRVKLIVRAVERLPRA